MSSAIGPSLPTPRILTETNAPAAVPNLFAGLPDASRAALYQSFGATAFPSGPLGIRAPLNSEDAAIVLAQAALAIDQANKDASNNRIENRVGGLRSGVGGAIADLLAANKDLAKATTDRAKAVSDRTTAAGKETSLTSQMNTLKGEITQIDIQLAEARQNNDQAGIDRLTTQRQTLVDQRSDVYTQLTNVQNQIKTLDNTIAQLDLDIPVLQASVQRSGLALISAYSTVATLFSSDGDQAKDVAASLTLDQRFDDLTDTLKRFQESTLARTEADAKQTDEARSAEASRSVVEAALGLAAGLAEVVDLLRQADPEPALNAREAAITAGQRLQLAL